MSGLSIEALAFRAGRVAAAPKAGSDLDAAYFDNRSVADCHTHGADVEGTETNVDPGQEVRCPNCTVGEPTGRLLIWVGNRVTRHVLNRRLCAHEFALVC